MLMGGSDDNNVCARRFTCSHACQYVLEDKGFSRFGTEAFRAEQIALGIWLPDFDIFGCNDEARLRYAGSP